MQWSTVGMAAEVGARGISAHRGAVRVSFTVSKEMFANTSNVSRDPRAIEVFFIFR